MTISAKMILDSISPQGIRLRTFLLRYPRFIHAEELTHRILGTSPESLIYESIPDGLMYDRDLSRNASSSRAIPVHRMIDDLRRDPVMPIYWGSAKPGMQAGDELTGEALLACKAEWLDLMEQAILSATLMMQAGLHKQVANRVLEPWAHINVVVTATNFENFYALRRHKDAQPEIKKLADLMWAAEAASTPKPLLPGDWHLPFIEDADWDAARIYTKKGRITRDEPRQQEIISVLKEVSTSRCARTSYLTHEGKPTTVEEDLVLYARLVGSTPLHASPTEHQATPDTPDTIDHDGNIIWMNPYYHGNLEGWMQNRKFLLNEYITE